MSSSTIRIRPGSHRMLKEIAMLTGKSLQDALEEVLEDRRRRIYLEEVDADYAALKRNSKAYAEFKKEAEVWDKTNLDGLDKP